MSVNFVKAGLSPIRKSKPIKCYKKYPKGIRGDKNLVNIIPRKNKDKNENCVSLNLKSHIFLSHPEIYPGGSDKLKNSAKVTCDVNAGKYFKDINVILPQKKGSSCCDIDDFPEIERENELCIGLYQLCKVKKAKKEDDDRYALHFIRKPNLKRYDPEKKKHLDLLFIGGDHVCLIRDMQGFLHALFDGGKKTKSPRCQYCFAKFSNEDVLKEHLEYAACYDTTPIPPKVLLPRPGTTIKKDNLREALPPYLVCYADIETVADQNDPDKHKVFSFGYTFIDEKGALLTYNSIVATEENPDIEELILPRLQSEYAKWVKHIEDRLCPEARLTPEQEDEFQNSECCTYCHKVYHVGNHRVQHHDHTKFGVLSETEENVYTEGNFVAAACNNCNLKITQKRANLPIVIHNGGSFDLPIILPNLVPRGSKAHIRVLPKAGSSYYNVKIGKLSFIDSRNFLTGSLEKLIALHCSKVKGGTPDAKKRVLPITWNALNKSRFNNELMAHVDKKNIYPYDFLRSIPSFKEETFPSKEDFFNRLTGEHISQTAFEEARGLYSENDCFQTLHDWHDFYLMLDVTLLADVMEQFREMSRNGFGVDPLNFLTGSSCFYHAALCKSKVELELLHNIELFEFFEKSVRGGFTGVSKRLCEANNIHIENYDGSDVDNSDSFLFFFDFNSLYAQCQTYPLPYSGFSFLESDDGFEDFLKHIDLFDVPGNDKKGYMLVVDYEIPDDLRVVTDDMPLSIFPTSYIKASPHTENIMTNTKACHKKLIASHHNMERYPIHIRLLKLYLKMGVKIKKNT